MHRSIRLIVSIGLIVMKELMHIRQIREKLKRVFRRQLMGMLEKTQASDVAENSLPDTKVSTVSLIWDTPIFRNNRSLEWPKQLVEVLSRAGFRNITILDNDSAYPPLLDYYEGTIAYVRRLGGILGCEHYFFIMLNEPENTAGPACTCTQILVCI